MRGFNQLNAEREAAGADLFATPATPPRAPSSNWPRASSPAGPPPTIVLYALGRFEGARGVAEGDEGVVWRCLTPDCPALPQEVTVAWPQLYGGRCSAGKPPRQASYNSSHPRDPSRVCRQFGRGPGASICSTRA